MNFLDLTAPVMSSEWLIQDVLPKGKLGMVFGDTGVGKSFVLFDLAAALAEGRSWFGIDLEPCRTLYVCPDLAKAGANQRGGAYVKENGEKCFGNLMLASQWPDLRDAAEVDGWCRQILQDAFDKQVSLPALILIDAFFKPPTDENNVYDMCLIRDNCLRLCKALNATVLLVDYTAKRKAMETKGIPVLDAASDVELEVSVIRGKRSIQVVKSKNGPIGRVFTFDLKIVDVGFATSCVVKEFKK